MAVPSATPADRRGFAGREHTRENSREKGIQEDIANIRKTFGPCKERDSRPVPFTRLAKLLEEVERYIGKTGETHASQRVNEAVGRLEKISEKLTKQIEEKAHPKSYAQALHSETATPTNHRLKTLEPPKEDPKKERQLVVKIGEQGEAEALRKLPTKDLIERLTRQAGDTQAARGVIAARQLGSGDIIIHVESKTEKDRLEQDTQWTTRIGTSATIKRRTYRVLIHGMRVADFPRDAGQANAKLIEEENKQLHPELNIKSVAWAGRVEGIKDYSSLIVEVSSATQANRMIQRGVVHKYDLKTTELFDRACRITQCFRCQRYGHIRLGCKRTERCGDCGGNHNTTDCTTTTRQKARKCAACETGDHPSWAKQCPARASEVVRVQLALKNRLRLHPEPRQPLTFAPYTPYSSNPQSNARAGNMRHPCESTDKEWTVVGEGKKRKIGGGRFIGSVNRAKAFPFPSQGIEALIGKQSQSATIEITATPPPMPSLNSEPVHSSNNASASQAPYTPDNDPMEECPLSSGEC